ncbi:nucleotidyl transferase AbiEii/AbiGii toxin family protein [Myxococcus landrumensis]|uniref:Nucleotidyl transferase AbiEii/AbiGii toxin family protein n=1 Tax=Myxococcus landrumensis TaxID=2813577 RepID=A0ABX7NE91_9BACT|nr:nucleotidyl transferase AbiEii/AbiGii toxin family protein [Myxococcus landrumus]QSQ17105.1 nucleotidyl transferase AbiEii/AbiGii toxin family protein [Myxococcus landrumus]
MTKPDDPKYPRQWLPKGFEQDARRTNVFDPALKQYGAAYIKAAPRFDDVEEEAAFRAARSRLLRKSLLGIGRASVADRLVVRGSIALELWYGPRARPAKDIDLVITPETFGPTSSEGQRVISELRQAVAGALREEGICVEPEAIPADDIWTYDRVEGRRLSFPWTWRGHLRDTVQVDIVFNERMCDAPVPLTVEGVALRGTSPAESLASKLLWLTNDWYPQGKDLFDAVLLAEDVRLPAELLRRVFAEKHGHWKDLFLTGEFALDSEVDWENFALENPALARGSAAEHWMRLKRALLRGSTTLA